MKKYLLAVCGLALALSFGASRARAQSGTVANGPDPSVLKDVEAEKVAKHELEVARHYFKNKKAYFAAFKRADELIAGYPEFSRLDEALYIAGMSSVYLLEGKGKQKLPKSAADKAQEYTPEALRSNARAYLSRLLKDFPKSKFRDEAQQAMDGLGGETPKKEERQ